MIRIEKDIKEIDIRVRRKKIYIKMNEGENNIRKQKEKLEITIERKTKRI